MAKDGAAQAAGGGGESTVSVGPRRDGGDMDEMEMNEPDEPACDRIKMDALMLAEEYPDFYLCSSPGRQDAADLVRAYDLVPADCEIFEQLVRALRRFHANRAAGGDRTSLRFEGAPLELQGVVETVSGHDVTDQVTDQQFHLVTSLEQLTGESVLSFGTSN